jgi:glutaredoxin
MITLIGKSGCSKCAQVKNLLDKRGIEYQYKVLDELDTVERDKYVGIATQNGISGFPLFFDENDGSLTLKDILTSAGVK